MLRIFIVLLGLCCSIYAEQNTTKKKSITYQEKPYALSLSAQLTGFETLAPRFDEMASIYFDVWPKLITMLGAPAEHTHRDVVIRFEKKMDHPAHASGNVITISAEHLERDPADTKGVFVHELTHVIQRYPVGQPSWFIEGAADYTRFKLHTTDRWAKWNRTHVDHSKPFGHYWHSAAFLLYLDETYQKPVMQTVSKALRSNKYQETIWKEITGKTLEQLAADYKSSGWKPAAE
ncbi:hypothetical protein NT6N_36310 [Oceaniferula spumae]|uniref:Secretory protein n=1 Tax=Oceaniferula spumae TaxID=2979115 RepID=A0AAT9FRD5_9BACT